MQMRDDRLSGEGRRESEPSPSAGPPWRRASAVALWAFAGALLLAAAGAYDPTVAHPNWSGIFTLVAYAIGVAVIAWALWRRPASWRGLTLLAVWLAIPPVIYLVGEVLSGLMLSSSSMSSCHGEDWGCLNVFGGASAIIGLGLPVLATARWVLWRRRRNPRDVDPTPVSRGGPSSGKHHPVADDAQRRRIR